MVGRTMLMLALAMVVAIPTAAADDVATLSLPLVEAEVSGPLPDPLQADDLGLFIPLGNDCIGGASGDDYVEYEDYPGGGFRLFVGAPIGPLPITVGIEVHKDAFVTAGEWVGVGVKVLGPGCEADQLLS